MGHVEIYQRAEWDVCDKCEKPKPKATGYTVTRDGEALVWLCEDCK